MSRLLPDWIDAFLEYTDNEEPPRVFQHWVAISTIAACLQRKCWITRGKLLWYPNLYVILCGPPSVGKGTSMRTSAEILTDMGGEVTFTPERVTPAEVIRTLENSQKSVNLMNGEPYEHCSITIFSEELSVLLRRDSEEMIEIITDWYDCKNQWDNKTKHSGSEYITNIWVNLIGATTPKKLAALPRVQTEGGFFARTVVVYADTAHCFNPEPALTERHHALMRDMKIDLQNICTINGLFKQTDEAREIYNKWYEKQKMNPPFKDDLLGAYAGRRAMILSKLCMVMSASRSNKQLVEVQDFERSLEFLTTAEINMRCAFGGVGDNKLVAVQNAIEKIICESNEPISVVTLFKDFRHDISHIDFTTILGTLQHSGIMRIIVIDKKRFVERVPAVKF